MTTEEGSELEPTASDYMHRASRALLDKTPLEALYMIGVKVDGEPVTCLSIERGSKDAAFFLGVIAGFVERVLGEPRSLQYRSIPKGDRE